MCCVWLKVYTVSHIILALTVWPGLISTTTRSANESVAFPCALRRLILHGRGCRRCWAIQHLFCVDHWSMFPSFIGDFQFPACGECTVHFMQSQNQLQYSNRFALGCICIIVTLSQIGVLEWTQCHTSSATWIPVVPTDREQCRSIGVTNCEW